METTLDLIEVQLRQVFVDNFPIDERRIWGKSHIEMNLGLDSLDIAELILCIESEFEIKMESFEERQIRTYESLLKLIYTKLNDEFRPDEHKRDRIEAAKERKVPLNLSPEKGLKSLRPTNFFYGFLSLCAVVVIVFAIYLGQAFLGNKAYEMAMHLLFRMAGLP
jgi:acyl carrier protein